MRVAIDPVPLVLGIYAYVGVLLERASETHEGDDAEELARRFGRQREEAADREVQQLVRSLHSGIKTADKLLKKTGNVWKISRETDLVNLVVSSRKGDEDPSSYVLLKPGDIRPLLLSIRDAARGTGEDDVTLDELEQAAGSIDARASDYLAFGFDPWDA